MGYNVKSSVLAASRLLAPAPGPSASSCQTALSIMASDPNLSAAYKNQILVNNVGESFLHIYVTFHIHLIEDCKPLQE